MVVKGERTCKICKEKSKYLSKGMCKRCYRREYRFINRDRIAKVSKIQQERTKEHIKEHRRNNLEKHNEYSKKYNRKHHQKSIATSKARKYVRIPRGYKCEICKEELAIERHHEDYNYIFRVDLLCHGCHMKVHKKKGAFDKFDKGLFVKQDKQGGEGK